MAKPSTKAELKSELYCRACGTVWGYAGNTIYTPCPGCGKKKDARNKAGWGKKGQTGAKSRERLGKLKEWYGDPENRKERGAAQRQVTRKRVFFRISRSIRPACVRCGCDDTRLLEINHKNGGGGKETERGKRSNQFYWDIATGKRAADDLELLCRACNAIHALELRFGPLPMKVVWEGHSDPSE